MTPHEQIIPYGFCHCDCGMRTDLAPYSCATLSWKKGEPKRFINGHNSRLLGQQRPPVEYGLLEGEEVAYIPLTRGFWTIVDRENEYLATMKPYYRKGYAVVTINLKSVRLHSLIFKCPEGLEPDHKNRNGLDNRASNLRTATHTQNCQNQSPQREHPTGYKGVTLLPSGKYRARIRQGRQSFNCGVHIEIRDAALAYDKKAVELCGDYAYLNFPELREQWLRGGVK